MIQEVDGTCSTPNPSVSVKLKFVLCSQLVWQVVSVPTLHDDALTGFFTSDLLETDEYEQIQLPSEPQKREQDLDEAYKK